MSARLQLPGAQGSNWMRNASLRSGVLTGIYLSCALVVWLVVANRVPKRIVDALELVEVEKHEREPRTVALGDVQCLRQLIVEARAVWELRAATRKLPCGRRGPPLRS